MTGSDGPPVVSASVGRLPLRYREPIATGRGPVTDREVVVVALTDADGVVGFGEAAPLAGFTPETPAEAETAIRAWLADEDAEPPLLATARAAIEGALFDLRARQLGVPLHEHLRPGSPSSIPVSALVAGTSPRRLARQARRAVEAGHRTVKVKVGASSIDDDVARVAAVRAAIGAAAARRLDANGAWRVTEAVANIERLAVHRPEMIEEPTSGVEGLAAVRAAVGVPVAADETAFDPAAVAAIIDSGAADLVVVKPSALGGLVAAAELIATVREAGLGVVVTSLLEGAIGVRAAGHLASSLATLDPAPGLATSSLLATDIATPPRLADGHLHLD